DASVGVFVGPGGFGVHVRPHHGHRGHHNHNRGHWGGNWGWQQPNYNYDQFRHHTPQGNWNHGAHHYGWGADGQLHHFDEYGHVNDATGHYQICTNAFGGYWYSYTGVCW
ncbi:MAG: hypothetical protein AB1758_14125, partial [Candidatus Eremiobacterota bacterium]